MLKNFGKLITVLVIAFSLFVLVGCTKEETIHIIWIFDIPHQVMYSEQ